MSELVIRRADAAERDEIGALLDASFAPSREESQLVARIAKADGTPLDWVALAGSGVVGYILYTPATRDGEPVGHHLAPVAVHPEFQNRGLGSALVRSTLAEPPLAGAPVFVLGDPAFYERFGFNPVRSARCGFDEGNRHFRALRWSDAGEPFEIGYHPAFGAAGEATA